MGYLDGMIASSFRRRDDGSVVYHPWGALGKGYELRDEAHHQEVRATVKRFAGIGYGLVFLVLFALPVSSALGLERPPWALPVAAAVLIAVLYFFWRRRIRVLLAGARQVDDRHRVSEIVPAAARRFGLPTLVVLELLSLAGFYFAATMWPYARAVEDGFMQTSFIAFMIILGTSAVFTAYMIAQVLGRRRSR